MTSTFAPIRRARRLLGTLSLSGMLSVTGVTASSFHVDLDHTPARAISAQVEVVLAPVPSDGLVFWALQVGVEDADGNLYGVHLGLQHYGAHPGARAVNFGGYGPDGAELTGSTSALPSATGNPNTRDFPWKAGTPYVLSIRMTAGGVVGVVDGTVVRTLAIPNARRLVQGVVWTEDFRACSAAPVVARWTELATNKGHITDAKARYQADGCTDTSTTIEGGNTLVQRTGAVRTTVTRLQLAA